MVGQVDTMRSKLIIVVLALVAVLIGAEYVRAGGDHRDGFEIAPSDVVAAELDPVFTQKLAERMRGPYARTHAFTTQARF